jgi:O-antigen/teichoic acid export membrane protein
VGTSVLGTSTTRGAVVLTGGRAVGFAVAFAIPIVLARHLTQEEFGTYKYLFLLWGTLGFLQLGMAESLYYFLPRSPDQAGPSVANAVVTLAVAGMTAAVVLAVMPGTLAGWLGNPHVATYLPLLGAFLALTLVTAPFEIVMVARKRYGIAAVTYAASDALRALLLVVLAVLTRDVRPLLVGALVFGAVRVVVMLAYLGREFRGSLRPSRIMWRAQWAYAIPFTAAVVLEVLQLNLHQYVVAARADAATFAIYSVGCMQVPLVDLIAMSAANVMMVRMGDSSREGTSVLPLWHLAVERLALVLLPLVVALVITARELIATLYTSAYLPSAPIFAVSAVLIALSAFPVDGVLRVYAETRFLILMNVIRLAITVAAIGWAFREFGLGGAIATTVVAQVVAKAAAVARISYLLRVRARQVLPWRSLTGIAIAASMSAGPALWTQAHVTAPPLVAGATIAVVYAISYATFVAAYFAMLPGAMGGRLKWLGTEGR